MKIDRATRAAALALVGASSLLAPLGAVAAHASLPAGETFSGVVTVSATCADGGQVVFPMGYRDRARGNIELQYSNSSAYGRIRLDGVGEVDTNGPKTRYDFTANTNEPLIACVDLPGMRAVVSYSVVRPPYWQTIAIDSSARSVALP